MARKLYISEQSLVTLSTAAEQVLNITRGQVKWKPLYDATQEALQEVHAALGIGPVNSVSANGHTHAHSG